MTTLAASIVLYDSDLGLLAQAIDALSRACDHAARTQALRCTLDLVNNKPGDENAAAIATLARAGATQRLDIACIESGVNGGYGAGNNLSIRRRMRVDFHLVLNPDVIVSEDSLANALAYLESNPQVGLLTPQVRGLDGTLHHLCKRHPTLFDMFLRSVPSQALKRRFAQRNRHYEMRDHDYNLPIRPVPYPTGCFMLFRRSLLDRIGGFDEGFFLHYEDADIGRRVSQVSQTAYVPSVVVLHKWARDSHKSWRMRWITIKSGLRYWRKWGGVI